MKQWEYKEEETKLMSTGIDFLNEQGRDGWELVVVFLCKGPRLETNYWFKREIAVSVTVKQCEDEYLLASQHCH